MRSLDVISRNGVAPFRLTGAGPDSVGSVLQAGTVVGGEVEQMGDSIRINFRLHEGQSGAEFRRLTIVRPVSTVLDTREDLVRTAGNMLREWLGEEIELRGRERDTRSVAAWALVQRAEKQRKDAEQLIRQDALHDAFAAFSRADSLLAQAELVDSAWAEPSILRAAIEYRRSRLVHDPHDAEEPIRRGLAHAERALRLNPGSARALELRGTLTYWWHLLALVVDPQEREQQLVSARADLERAVQLDPTLASAFSTLSHLYARVHDMSSSVLAAQRAYEEDAYLETADVVLWRLVTGQYDQQSFEQSQRWCDTGASRFPNDYRFAQCRLLLMTTRAAAANPESAWGLLARIDSLVPQPLREIEHARSLILVGGVLGRAGMPDSANAVLLSARSMFTPELDPEREIYLNEAGIRAVVLNDIDGAIDLLKLYAAAKPDFDLEHGWWWREVRQHPRYAEIAAFQSDHH